MVIRVEDLENVKHFVLQLKGEIQDRITRHYNSRNKYYSYANRYMNEEDRVFPVEDHFTVKNFKEILGCLSNIEKILNNNSNITMEQFAELMKNYMKSYSDLKEMSKIKSLDDESYKFINNNVIMFARLDNYYVEIFWELFNLNFKSSQLILNAGNNKYKVVCELIEYCSGSLTFVEQFTGSVIKNQFEDKIEKVKLKFNEFDLISMLKKLSEADKVRYACEAFETLLAFRDEEKILDKNIEILKGIKNKIDLESRKRKKLDSFFDVELNARLELQKLQNAAFEKMVFAEMKKQEALQARNIQKIEFKEQERSLLKQECVMRNMIFSSSESDFSFLKDKFDSKARKISWNLEITKNRTNRAVRKEEFAREQVTAHAAAAAAAGSDKDISMFRLDLSKCELTANNIKLLQDLDASRNNNHGNSSIIEYSEFKSLAENITGAKPEEGKKGTNYSFVCVPIDGETHTVKFNLHRGHGNDNSDYLKPETIRDILKIFDMHNVFESIYNKYGINIDTNLGDKPELSKVVMG